MSYSDRIERLNQRRARSLAMGGEARIQKQHAAGKLTVRERIDLLFDPGTFIEYNQLVYDTAVDADGNTVEYLTDGLVTGHGDVNGRPAVVVAEDFTILGGSASRRNLMKLGRMYDLACRERVPLVMLQDGAGARAQEGEGEGIPTFFHFRELRSLSGLVPIVAAVMGPCAGHSALVAYDPSLVSLYPHDPERARKLLAEAGYPDGLEIRVIGWNDQRGIQRQEVLIEQLQKSGIRLRLDNFTPADGLAQYVSPDSKADCFLSAFSGRPDPSLAYQTLFAKESYFNAGKADPAPGRAEAQIASQAVDDVESRKKALAELQRIIMENAICVPLVIQYDLQAIAKSVQDYRPNLLGKPKFDSVWLDS